MKAWLLAMFVGQTLLSVAAQTGVSAPQVREQVTVELIEVPVYVVDPGGRPVRGLTREQFELRINGRKQPIEYFDAIDFAAPRENGAAATVSTRRPPRERRLYVLLFDTAYSPPGFVARAQRAAHHAVDRSNPSTDLFAIATYTNKGVQFATAFVSDRVAVHRAIDTLSISGARDPLRIAVPADERTQWSTGAKGEAESLDQMMGGLANQQMIGQPATYRTESLLSDFTDLASRLAALEGQKRVLYLSTGFDAGPLSDDARTSRILYDMFNAYRAAGVFLDAIDAAGMRSKWDNTKQLAKTPEVNPANPNDPAFAARKLDDALRVDDSLQMVASGTGGQFIHDTNDLAGALTKLESSQQVVYILGFNRRSAKGGEVSVRVDGLPVDARVSYRQGFGAVQRPKDPDPLQIADILINDVPQNGLTLPIRALDGDVEVAVPVDQVRAQLVEKSPYVDLLLYVFDEHGDAIEGSEKRIRFDDNVKGAMVIRKRFDLPPGNYVIKAIARIEGTASLGFARTALTISKSRAAPARTPRRD